MTSAIIGSGVTELRSDTFAYCDSLTRLTIPPTVTTIDRNLLGGSFNENLVIVCQPDSQADKFAKAYGIKTEPLSGSAVDTGKKYSRVDLDGDGVTTANDALIVLRMSVGLENIDLSADADNDGSVTSNDALVTLQYSAGLL